MREIPPSPPIIQTRSGGSHAPLFKMILHTALRLHDFLNNTHEGQLFANAFACGTGKRALFATHHSIPVAQLFGFMPSCFKWVMLVHAAAQRAMRALALADG